jgi:signal transduction histidine kinase/ActR/RegA family two-component response regulator
MPSAPSAIELRTLILAPVGRDGPLTEELFKRAQLPCHLCRSVREVCDGLGVGAGAVLMTEEALSDPHIGELGAALAAQPAWSDISVLLFTGNSRDDASTPSLRRLEALGNLTLLERPIRIAAVISTVQSALRGRQRQYELRDVLVALHTARAEAERANRLKDEFLATLSHELRTPLNAILGWVSMLRQSQIEPARIPRVLDIVDRNAHVQAQLIADVLDVSRMITGQIRLQLAPESVQRIVLDTADSIRPTASAKGVELAVVDVEPALPISADARRLQQVFWNLLSNAVKFTPAGGRVTVTTRRVDSDVEIAVADTGGGITREFLPFVFDRFRQADQTFTRTQGGLGLGLAIVKHLVEMHGGTVSAASPGAGGGATFCVRLPLVSEGVLATTPSPPSATDDGSPPVDLQNRLVLVVEDDPSTRELLVAVLEFCRARVVAVASARAAMSALDQEVPAVLVADIGLPDQDGLSLMRNIRSRSADRGGAVRSIAVSAYASAEDQAAALTAGFDDFLSKPAIPVDVARAVKRWIAASDVLHAGLPTCSDN